MALSSAEKVLSPMEPQPSLEGLDSLESDQIMPSLESLDLSFEGAGTSFDNHFGPLPHMTTEKAPTTRTRAVSTTSGPNLIAKLGTPPRVVSRPLGALQPKVLTLPLSPSLDNHGTAAGGVGRVKAMQRDKRLNKYVQPEPQSALIVAPIRRTSKSPDFVAVDPGLEATQPQVPITTPPMSSPQDYYNSAVSLVDGWEIYAVSDTRCETSGSADGTSPRADYSPLPFGSRDGSFSSGGRSQSSAMLSSRPPSMRQGSQVSKTLAGYPAVFSAPQGLPTSLPPRRDQRRGAHRPSFLGAAKTSASFSTNVNEPNKDGAVARRRRRRRSGTIEHFRDGGKDTAIAVEADDAAANDHEEKVGPRGRFAGGSGKGTSAGTPGAGGGGGLAAPKPAAGVALGRGGALQPGDFVADPPCSAPLAASFLALGNNEGHWSSKHNRSNSGGKGVHSRSAPAAQQQRHPRQRRTQRSLPRRASAPVNDDGSAASDQEGAFFLTGVDGFEAVTPDAAVAGDGSYANASGTSATGVTSAPSLLPPWQRPAYPQLREGSATAAALTAANRHFVENQRTFVDCEGRHKTYQAELTVLKSEQQQALPTKASSSSSASISNKNGRKRVLNDGANFLLRLAGSASDHGGGPRSGAPGQASTYRSCVGSLHALPPPGVHHHPLHATHTALRGAVDREQRLVVTEGYVRSAVWKSTLRELGNVASRLPA